MRRGYVPAHIRDSDTPLETMAPERRKQATRSARRQYNRDEIEEAMRQSVPRQHKPRNTWHQPGWSDVSPYYRTMATIDSRWDK